MHLPAFKLSYIQPLLTWRELSSLAKTTLGSHIKEELSPPGPPSYANQQEHHSENTVCIGHLGCGIWLSLPSLQSSF